MRIGLPGVLSWRGELRFEVGDALVVEPEVVPGGLEPLVEGAVVGGELADALFEGGVLGGDPGDGLFGPLGLQVSDLAEELADAGPLGEDLGVGGLECVLGVQRPLPPGRLLLVVLGGEHLDAPLSGLGQHGRDCGPGVRVAVEEGPGHVCPPADGGDGDLGLLPAEAGDRVVDALEGGLGCALACGECGCGAHAQASSMSSLASSSPPGAARSVARKAVEPGSRNSGDKLDKWGPQLFCKSWDDCMLKCFIAIAVADNPCEAGIPPLC